MTTLVEEFQRSWLTSLIGINLFIFGICLLIWNEGRAVHHTHSLDEAFNNAITLNPYEKLKPEYDGRVVYITGDLVVDEPLTEPDYGISIQAVKLKRRVQMYQWVEETSPRSDDDIMPQKLSDDYYYVTEWRDKLVDSSSFYIRHGHQNPTEMPLKTVVYVSPNVFVGALSIGEDIKEIFNDFTEVASDERPERRNVKLHMGIYYHCQDIFNPEVGDIRVQFYYAGIAGEPVTIIAKQQDGVLVPYETSKGYKIALLRHGTLNINQMFNAEHADARAETWKLRFYGCALIHFAMLCLCKLLKIMLSRNAYLANVVSGEPSALNNYVLSFSFSLIVIAINWILYRPVIGAGLLVAGISPFLYCTLGIYNAAQNGLLLRS